MENFCHIKEVELLLGHTKSFVCAILKHSKQNCQGNASSALLPHRVLGVLYGNQYRNKVVKVLINLIVNLFLIYLDCLNELGIRCISLALKLVPFFKTAKALERLHKLESRAFGIIPSCIRLIMRIQELLVAIPYHIKRIPTVGRIRITKVDNLNVIATANEIL